MIKLFKKTCKSDVNLNVEVCAHESEIEEVKKKAEEEFWINQVYKEIKQWGNNPYLNYPTAFSSLQFEAYNKALKDIARHIVKNSE